MKITVSEFEEKFRKIEGIPIVIRADPQEQVDEYNYIRASADTDSINQVCTRRIDPCLNGLPYVILDDNVEEIHGRTSMKKIRGMF